MEMIKDTYDNGKTFANAKSIVRRVNTLLELKPLDYLHVHIYVSDFDKLCDRMVSVGMAKTKKEVVYTMNQLTAIIKRFDINKTHGLRDKIDAFNYSDAKLPEVSVTENVARSWEDMLKLFNYEIENNPSRNAKLACVIFKHGYVLNLKELFATTTQLGRPIVAGNFLDLDNLTWTLHDHKNDKVVSARKFNVTQEFVDELKKYIELDNYLLFYKSDFQMYSTALLSSLGISEFKNSEVRDSYINWLWSNKSIEEATRISQDIIGYLPQAVKQYAVKFANVGRNDPQSCDPHPLHLENPIKYSVNGKIKIVATPRAISVSF